MNREEYFEFIKKYQDRLPSHAWNFFPSAYWFVYIPFTDSGDEFAINLHKIMKKQGKGKIKGPTERTEVNINRIND